MNQFRILNRSYDIHACIAFLHIFFHDIDHQTTNIVEYLLITTKSSLHISNRLVVQTKLQLVVCE